MSRTPDQRWRRAMGYLEQGLLTPAHAQLEALQVTAPKHACTQLLAAEIAWREDRIRDAATFALDAAGSPVEDPELACDVVAALLRVGEVVAAREYLVHTARADGMSPTALARMADFRVEFGEYAEALALLDRALAAGDGAASFHFYRGRLLTFLGRLQEAESGYLHGLRLDPTLGEAALALVTLRTQTPDHNHLSLLAAGLQGVSKGTRGHAAFEFARYKTLEDLGRYDEAWGALARANAVMHARTRENARLQDAGLRRTVDYYAAHSLPRSGGAQDGPQPIFIVGLPRSGTTVLERLLANHSEVMGAGELFDFGRQLQWAADHRSLQDDTFFARLAGIDAGEVGRRYLAQTQWRARGARWFVDKQTTNWMLAGLIHAALPGARILHLVRDPMDNCFSIFRALFGDAYAIGNDLATLAAHHRNYRRLMSRWHALAPGAILDVAYDDLVGAPEATMRRVLAHCGLDWEPACADLARNRDPVSTMSAIQVRQPLRRQSAGAWHHYEAQLLDLRSALVDARSDPAPATPA